MQDKSATSGWTSGSISSMRSWPTCRLKAFQRRDYLTTSFAARRPTLTLAQHEGLQRLDRVPHIEVNGMSADHAGAVGPRHRARRSLLRFRHVETPINEPGLRPLWRQRNYMLLWSGQVVSSLGSGMTSFALPLLILAITHSPAIAGVASALYALPYPLFSLPVGALMDRWNRKRVMITCDAIRAINIATIPLALALDALTIPQIFVNAFVEGSCFVVFNIAEVAALSRVVEKVQLPSASAQNEVAFGLVGLLSPSIGGFLYKAVSPVFPFLVDAVS
jgi:hypothetical protein